VFFVFIRLLGGSTEWFTPNNATWNEATADETDILELISRKQVDAVVSDITVTPSRADIVSFTVPLLTYR
jgi:ABC-type amino acid transport substrate-binding protein